MQNGHYYLCNDCYEEDNGDDIKTDQDQELQLEFVLKKFTSSIRSISSDYFKYIPWSINLIINSQRNEWKKCLTLMQQRDSSQMLIMNFEYFW